MSQECKPRFASPNSQAQMTQTSSSPFLSPAVQDAVAMRRAGADLLSMALMDARTRTLGWLSVFEGLALSGRLEGLDPPLWLIGQVGWHQEYWIARHLQRSRGAAADPAGLRLASLDPRADAWFNPQASSPAARWRQVLPEADALRDYLQATLDATLDLLDKAGDTEAGLHVFHEALHHEDLAGETLAMLAQALDLSPERQARATEAGLWQPWRSSARRDAIGLPGQRLALGAAPGIWAPGPERGALALSLDDFEIDAQPVSWAQFAEFVDDAAYDNRACWTAAGWDWVEATVRRAPRYVAQFTGGVLARRQGRLQRLPAGQPAVHVSAHEADAWCCWSGRRLPSDAEWTLAAQAASARGFAWGDVCEWVAGSARAYPGGVAPEAQGLRVLRGSSLQASPRLRHPAARRYARPTADAMFCGFRSCVV